MRKQTRQLIGVSCVVCLLLCACGRGGYDDTYDDYSEYDPSDIYQFDFSGYWYSPSADMENEDGSLYYEGYDDYDLMIMFKTGDSPFDTNYYEPLHYEIYSDGTGYVMEGNTSGYQLSFDFDLDNRILKTIEPSGMIRDTFEIEYCEEIEEWYLVKRSEYMQDKVYIRLNNPIS